MSDALTTILSVMIIFMVLLLPFGFYACGSGAVSLIACWPLRWSPHC